MKEGSYFIIVNPTAGSGKAHRMWPRISQELKDAGVEYELVFSQWQGHCAALAQKAIKDGWRHIAAVGGDGTCNEVVNGIMQQSDVPSSEISFGLIAVGTGNDWIRTHNIPKNIKGAVQVLKNGNTTFQDVGKVTCQRDGETVEHYFVNVAGFCFDGFVGEIASRNRKFVSNKMYYLALTMASLWKYDVPRTRIIYDGKEVEAGFYTINAGICRYSGGGMQLVPHAIPDDGLFALTLAKDISKADVILSTHRFYTGTIGSHPKIETLQARHIRIEPAGSKPVHAEVDGEFIGIAPLDVEIFDKALKVLVP